MIAVCVGNDVVDLRRPRTEGRAADERFVSRVFAAGERRTIRSAAEPDLELWCHWAAKEAGYKVVSKLVGEPPPFVHADFAVAWDECEAADEEILRPPTTPPSIRRGTVSWREHHVRVSVARGPGAVHAVAFARRRRGGGRGGGGVRPRVALLDDAGSPWAAPTESLLALLTAREADAVHSRASAAVRVGARSHLARLLGVAERRLEIVCAPGRTSQRPPRVLLDGEETDADVSLSHDGRLIAWTVWADVDPEREREREREDR